MTQRAGRTARPEAVLGLERLDCARLRPSWFSGRVFRRRADSQGSTTRSVTERGREASPPGGGRRLAAELGDRPPPPRPSPPQSSWPSPASRRSPRSLSPSPTSCRSPRSLSQSPASCRSPRSSSPFASRSSPAFLPSSLEHADREGVARRVTCPRRVTAEPLPSSAATDFAPTSAVVTAPRAASVPPLLASANPPATSANVTSSAATPIATTFISTPLAVACAHAGDACVQTTVGNGTVTPAFLQRSSTISSAQHGTPLSR